MSDGHASMSVEPDEALLRRSLPTFHPERKKSGQLPPVWTDFRPTKEDGNGISVTRRIYVQNLVDEAKSQGEGKPRALLEFHAKDAHALGLSVVADPIPNNPGHTLIPQLNRLDYDDSSDGKQRITEWAMQLAQKCTLVFDPPFE